MELVILSSLQAKGGPAFSQHSLDARDWAGHHESKPRGIRKTWLTGQPEIQFKYPGTRQSSVAHPMPRYKSPGFITVFAEQYSGLPLLKVSLSTVSVVYGHSWSKWKIPEINTSQGYFGLFVTGLTMLPNLASSDPPASSSWVGSCDCRCHHTQQQFINFKS